MGGVVGCALSSLARTLGLAVGAVALLMGAIAAAPAGAAEVGECAPQKPGGYSDTACRVRATGAGRREWRELGAAVRTYTDEHPEVLGDEKQVFLGEGVKLECKGNVTVGEVTSFTTNVQFAHEYKCELLVPFRAKCGNVATGQIDTMPEEGVFFDGPEGTVLNRLTMSASFECGGMSASLSGEYTGKLGLRFIKDEPIVNKVTNHYELLVRRDLGAQALSLTVGLRSWPVSLTGEQEDRFPTRFLVVATGTR
jgi:hypothetical protein